MSWAIAARVLAAVLPLPLGGAAARGALGLALVLWLSAHAPPPPAFTMSGLLAELALGAAMGLLAALPAHAGQGLAGDGPAALGQVGRALSWAVFFGMAGPALWGLGLAGSLRVAPAAAWPAGAVVEGGGALFAAAVALGLPCWVATLAVGPLAGWVGRVGQPGAGAAVWAMRPAAVLALWVVCLPFAADWLGSLWQVALGG
ncbi:MAG: hypothetical protein H6702_05150 [Myxococcales bacterium]|nr:hypothetical protein [Myxococcales bacterium]